MSGYPANFELVLFRKFSFFVGGSSDLKFRSGPLARPVRTSGSTSLNHGSELLSRLGFFGGCPGFFRLSNGLNGYQYHFRLINCILGNVGILWFWEAPIDFEYTKAVKLIQEDSQIISQKYNLGDWEFEKFENVGTCVLRTIWKLFFYSFFENWNFGF